MTDNLTTGGLNELALFAGAGGGCLGGFLLGWRTICAVEQNPYAAGVLAARQNDGSLHPFPIWDDVRTFDGTRWRGRVDIISGGFPCQDISVAGTKQGLAGERSGLWREFARIIRQVEPAYVFVENSPALTVRGLDTVLGDLAALGYDAEWDVFGADNIGAPHRRKRIWIVGQLPHASSNRRKRTVQSQSESGSSRATYTGRYGETQLVADADNQGQSQSPTGREHQRLRTGISRKGTDVADSQCDGLPRQRTRWFTCDPAEAREGETNQSFGQRVGHVWGIESTVGRVADGVAYRVDRLRAIGNGQVPSVAALAWCELHRRLNQ
jgi:DNA (cytosine-5)-methyltransferase 1